jgi:transcriptional regulator with XRE-family HTH domain
METTTGARLLTNEELGAVILLTRKIHQWSQETLTELTGLTTRTIQRIEGGKGASADSRRALGKAFNLEDIDTYNKPFLIPTAEEIEKQKKDFEQERITLATVAFTTGKQLVQLAETTQAHLFTSMDGIPNEADRLLAEIEDRFTDFRDVHEHYSANDKVDMYVDFQGNIDALKALGVELCHATRRVSISSASADKKPIPFMIIYMLACPIGKVPESMAVSREISFG